MFSGPSDGVQMLKEPNTWLPSRTLSISFKNSQSLDRIMTLRCLGIGWPLAKRLSPTVGQNCTIGLIAKDIRDTGNLNAFKKRIFKYLFDS